MNAGGRGNGRHPATSRRLVADLGATHLRVAVEAAGEIGSLAVHRTADLARRPGRGIAPAVVEALVESWAAMAGPNERPAGVGVGVAAYVARDGGVLQERPFGLLPGTALRDGLAEAFGCPVAVDNDANLAALGELRHGAGRGCEDFLLVTLGTNIGLGIVSDGRLIRGAHGAAGEAGNMLVPARRGRSGTDRMGRAGRFGEGVTNAPARYALLEELVGGGALARALAASDPAGDDDAGPSGRSAGASTRPDGVFVRALAGDRRALTVTRRAIEGWALLFAHLVALFDPARIVLSGGLVEDLRPFIEPLRRRAAALSPLPPDIRIGELGAIAGLVGAAEAARIAAPPAIGPRDLEPDERLATTRR